MELDIIKLQTTWNDAAGSINSNYAKIADAIAQLKANGGGGGGGADIDLTDYATKVWVEAKGYITASALTQYALKSDIPSLVGYATEDFVTTKLVNYAPLTSIQGFENRIGGLEGAVPQLNERVTTVAGEVSTLNEIVSTGKNNLLDRVNTIETDYVTSGNLESAINDIDLSAYLLKADLTKSRIQSTLGISDWALASAKPTYTASEVGATPSFGNVGVNSVKGNGLGYTYATSAHGGHTSGGFISFGNTSYGCQLNGSIYGGELAFRGLNNGTFTGWKTLAFTSDIPTKLSQLTDDVVAGRYLPLSGGTLNGSITATSFIGSLTGNADSATKLATRCKLWGQSFDGTRNITGHLWSDTWRIVTDATFDGAFFQSKNYDGTSNAGNIYLTGWDVNTLESFNVRAKNSYFSNNVIASGLFMNIGKEISPYASNRAEIALINPNAEPSMLRLGSNGDVKWGIETRGSTDNYAFSIYSWTAATHCLRILNNGNVGIGNTSPAERLDVTGNIKASGNINATSITINGVTITASNGSITVNGNVFATGDITGGV